MVILYQYANAVIFLCSRVSGQPSHATAPALMFLEATRTIIRGRQPRSGLMCILCKLMFLCSRGKRQAQTLYLMSLCPYVFRVSGQPIHATAPALMSLEATRTIVRGRQPRSGLMCILCKLMFLCSRGKRQAQTLYLMSLCPYVFRVSGQPIHATAPALMSLEATRTIVRGRQPRSGLMCILCKLMFLCSRGKRQAQTLYLMSLCPYVLLFSALAANAPSNKQAMVRRVTLPH